MLKNYIKIAVRNLFKKKGYSFVNIFGLAIGIATSLLIISFVLHELSYDDYHEKADRIYRVIQTMSTEDKTEEQASTPFPLGPVLKAEFPNQVQEYVRFYNLQEKAHTILNRQNNISFRESNTYFVDSSFFNVFTAKLIQGNPDQVLKNPQSFVITKSIAEKYFGDENPVGQQLSFKGSSELFVTGVMDEWPEESHLKIDLLASFSTLDRLYANSPGYDESWFWNPVWTYILVQEGTDINQLESQINDLKENYYYASPGWPDQETVDIYLQPVPDIHLHSNRDSEMNANSSILYIYILLAVSGFILLIACINFMNLSTVRSLERSREVGLRKVLGGHRQQLFYQFMGESFFVTLLSVILGILLVYLTLPYFNSLVGKELSFELFNSFYTIPLVLILTLVVGLISGSYPALFLSKFEPVKVLKGLPTQGNNGTAFRKVLVTFQFSLSVILLAGTAILFLQLRYIQQKDLGFDTDNIVMLPTKQNLITWEFETFKEQALAHAQIQTVTGLGKIPGSEKQEYYRYVPAAHSSRQGVSNLVLHVTHDFIETFNLEIIAGRTFSKDYATDADQAVLINRSMLTQLDANSPEEALGELFHYYPSNNERVTYSVVGVVEDFNYTSLKKEIEPLIIRLVQGTGNILRAIEHTAVKIAPGNPKAALKHLETTWKELNHIDPFEYVFLDQRLQQIYEEESTMSRLSIAFSILSIIVACLGLLGLASYAAQLKQKEIGIRKSLGASVSNILYLLSKDFMKLVLIANIIAWPVVYYVARQWLNDFPYRFDFLSNLPILFGGSLLLIMVVAFLTVSYHSLKAAMINPVEAIRNE